MDQIPSLHRECKSITIQLSPIYEIYDSVSKNVKNSAASWGALPQLLFIISVKGTFYTKNSSIGSNGSQIGG